MTQQLARQRQQPEPLTIEQALVQGDLSGLQSEERIAYYLKICNSLQLNPYTKPFAYLTLNNRLVLYALKDCTDQLRNLRKVSITRLEREQMGDLLVVTASARGYDGRTDSSIGAVNVAGLKGEALANAMMKAETKAKRRVTLSLCGLGMLDESEIESIPDARTPTFDDDAEPEPPAQVTRGDDPLWQRWLALCVEAADVSVVPDLSLELPVDRERLIAAGKALAAEIEDARDKEPVF